MKFGVVVFPGSNCDHDAYHVVSKHVGQPVDFIWHQETNLAGYDAIIVPGGFSYGDYLRAGALAIFPEPIPYSRSIMETLYVLVRTGQRPLSLPIHYIVHAGNALFRRQSSPPIPARPIAQNTTLEESGTGAWAVAAVPCKKNVAECSLIMSCFPMTNLSLKRWSHERVNWEV